MRGLYPRASWAAGEIERVWRGYWGGAGSVTINVPGNPPTQRESVASGVVWEYLIEGRLIRRPNPEGEKVQIRRFVKGSDHGRGEEGRADRQDRRGV